MGAWYPPPSRPRPADGIRARSRRGKIGATWWSRRFIDILESFPGLEARLVRGRRYARAGQVLDLEIKPGLVTSRVQGSHRRPYEARIETLTLSAKDWARVEQVMASRAVFLAKLLSGEMPRDIEQAFVETRLSLFPTSARDLTTDCSCPDWSNPCKHVAATYYLLAEAFDADPFLIFRWRGRDRGELLASLGGQVRAGVEGGTADGSELWEVPAAPVLPLRDCLDRFWDAPAAAVAPPHARPVTSAPDATVRGLDSGLLRIAGRPIGGLLAPVYAIIAEVAARRSLGDEAT